MKKHFIFLYLIILFVLLTIIFVLTYKQQNQMKEISLADVEDALKSKQDRMVYYGQEDCGQCKEFSKYIRKIMSEQDVEICYLDSDKLNMVDKEKLMQSVQAGQNMQREQRIVIRQRVVVFWERKIRECTRLCR